MECEWRHACHSLGKDVKNRWAFPYSFPVLVTEAKDPVKDSEAPRDGRPQKGKSTGS